MSAVSITMDGDHLTLVAADQVGSALATASWKTGAIMGHCSRIYLPSAAKGVCAAAAVRFVCPNADDAALLSQLATAMTATGPVNVGLTDDKGDGLRAVFYFPDARVAQRRMDAAIRAATAGGAHG